MTDRGNTFALDVYTLVDASASWHRGKWRVTLSAHNLLNEEYGLKRRRRERRPGPPAADPRHDVDQVPVAW